MLMLALMSALQVKPQATAEPGLAVARVLVDPPAGTAAQAGVGGPDCLHPSGRLVLGAPDEQTPALGQDRPVQAGLGLRCCRGSRLFLGRAGHVLYPQVLETDQVEPSRQAWWRPSRTSPCACRPPGHAAALREYAQRPVPRAFRRSGLAPLGLAQPGPFPAGHAGAVQSLARRQRRGDHYAPVNPDCLAGTWCGDRLGNDGECDVPPSGMVKGDTVGLALWHGACPPEPHPADLWHPDLAPAPIQPPYMQVDGEARDAESFISAALSATRVSVGAGSRSSASPG